MKKNRHVCDHCGKRFLPRIPKQRFCATGCRQAWMALHDKRKNHKRRMPPLGFPFPPPPPEPASAPDSGSDGTLDRLLSVLRFARDAGFDVRVVMEQMDGRVVASLELRGGR